MYLDGCLLEEDNLYRVVSKEYFLDDYIAALLDKTGAARETITFPDQSCFPIRKSSLLEDEPIQMLEKFAYLGDDEYVRPNGERERFERLGCYSEVNVRWLNRKFWPKAVPTVDQEHSSWARTASLLSCLLDCFTLKDFERRERASMANSVEYGRQAADKLIYDYIVV
jgi:hypothetical protein